MGERKHRSVFALIIVTLGVSQDNRMASGAVLLTGEYMEGYKYPTVKKTSDIYPVRTMVARQDV